jgi:hypothetical protein
MILQPNSGTMQYILVCPLCL